MSDLLRFVFSSGLSDEQIGALLGVSSMCVRRWRLGEARPSRLVEREFQRVLAEMAAKDKPED